MDREENLPKSREERIEAINKMVEDGINDLRQFLKVPPGRHFKLEVNPAKRDSEIKVDELFLVRGTRRSSIGLLAFQEIGNGARVSIPFGWVDRCVVELLHRLWCLAKEPVVCRGTKYFAAYVDLRLPEVAKKEAFSRGDDILLDHATI